jgi:tetratricopeptide (TPR) repeat protein
MSQSPQIQQQSKRRAVVREMREHLSKDQDQQVVALADDLGPKLRADPEILFLKASALERLRGFAAALEAAKRSVRALERVESMLVVARCHRCLGDTEDALRWCDRVLEKLPRNEIVLALKAGTLEEAGRFDEATEILLPIVDAYKAKGQEPPTAVRLEWAKLLVQSKQHEEAIRHIDDTLAPGGLPDNAVCAQLHLKAKACDRMKDFARAWEAAEEANEIGRLDFDPDLYEQQVDALIENWSRERMETFPISQCDSDLPVFVAGMPRSGTSLIDQIIDAHPRASGVGELSTIEHFAIKLGQAYDAEKEPPACFGSLQATRWTKAARDYVREVKKLAPPGTERVVNKALGNNKLVGLIARLFPNTRIIHAIRDPRDVSISCFMGGFNNRMHPWTTRVEWAACAWEQSMRMMEHWKASLDVPILDVHYEKLVADPEHEFPRLIEFLGLEWDDRCFEFHKTRRTVRTLSYDQVNRPLYKSSSGRHANYAEQIASIDFPPYGI